jgi:competence protein CoiA
MPLRALHLPTNNVILSSDFSSSREIRSLYKKEDLICPFCEIRTRMDPVQRGNSIIYFRHYKSICTSKLEHDHDESPEHLLGKTMLANYLKEELREVSDVEIIIEYPIREAGENGRIADVAAVFPTGYVIVYECQLANITAEMLEKRTKDYEEAGVEVTWFLGGKADNHANRDWCLEYFGNCYYIKFQREFSEQHLFEWKSEGNHSLSNEGRDS